MDKAISEKFDGFLGVDDSEFASFFTGFRVWIKEYASMIQAAFFGDAKDGIPHSISSNSFDLLVFNGVPKGVAIAHGIGPSSWE